MKNSARTVVSALIAVGVLASVTACNKNQDAAKATSSPATSAAAPAAATTAPAAVKTTAEAQPVTLLNISGSGTKQTANFTAAGQWTIAYTYDCTSFLGGTGNFIASVYDKDGTPSFTNTGVNQLGAKGSDSTVEHSSGTYYLSIDSECDWTITVTG